MVLLCITVTMSVCEETASPYYYNIVPLQEIGHLLWLDAPDILELIPISMVLRCSQFSC